MKHFLHCLTVFFIGLPSAVLGYLWFVAQAGFSLGRSTAQLHEKAAIERFVKKQPSSGSPSEHP